MIADLIMHYGWSIEKILWCMTTEQVFWWHDVLVARLNNKPLYRETEWKTAEEINDEFVKVNGRWVAKK